jgi:hypothetical protein
MIFYLCSRLYLYSQLVRRHTIVWEGCHTSVWLCMSRDLESNCFRTHETVEILEFCFTNNIILCRLPSYTSYRLQPCDVAVFAPLKAAYREQAERLERGGVNTIGKEHFTSPFSPARKIAFTLKNITAGLLQVDCLLSTQTGCSEACQGLSSTPTLRGLTP